jgi:hypothetical protein
MFFVSEKDHLSERFIGKLDLLAPGDAQFRRGVRCPSWAPDKPRIGFVPKARVQHRLANQRCHSAVLIYANRFFWTGFFSARLFRFAFGAGRNYCETFSNVLNYFPQPLHFKRGCNVFELEKA